jgi:putative chitinase
MNFKTKIKMTVTNDLLKAFLPDSSEVNRAKYLPWLNKYMPQYGIISDKQVAAFFAQIGTESGQLKYNKEIASGSAYEGRRDLGNSNPGDGVKYKGRGLIQITGRSNYEKACKALGADFINHPELLEQPEFAVKSACWWWSNAGLNKVAG